MEEARAAERESLQEEAEARAAEMEAESEYEDVLVAKRALEVAGKKMQHVLGDATSSQSKKTAVVKDYENALVGSGLGRVVALRNRSSTSNQVR